MSPMTSNLRFFPRSQTAVPARARTPKSRAARILRAGYICDIIRDTDTDPSIFHWVVQNCETDEILGLGQAHTLPEAEMAALMFLDDLRIRRAI